MSNSVFFFNYYNDIAANDVNDDDVDNDNDEGQPQSGKWAKQNHWNVDKCYW